ncbi:TonB-dependent receptor [Archangium sp.]|uniref:TonB-dependent receptor n=1 Tax=Archangium sp. TaxID=1872627 RepID=UPI002D61E14C|nr:TonB-dependent receptor [Archangium sp.]HYO52415.1 TonB-dependent receptor [Archangium sp.]
MRTTPGVLLALLVGSVSQAEETPTGTGAPLTFESSELHDLAGTWGEPFRSLMVMPGVSHVISGASLPVVRGAAPSSTGFYLDGVRVPQLYHLWVGPSTLHPELVSGLDFHRGPAPARFGRELGGTVDARLLPPSTDTVRAVGSLDLFNVGVLTQVPLASTGTEFTLAGRFAYTPWIAAAVINGIRGTPGPDLVLGLFDYQARITQSVGRGSLRLFALGSSDDAGLSGTGDVVRLGTAFHRVDLRLTHPLGVGEAEAAITWGQDTLGATGGGEASRITVGLSERTLGARMAWRASLSQRLAVEAGADVERRLADVNQSTTFRPGEADDPSRPTVTTGGVQTLARATFAGAYAQATWTQGPWQLTPGLRVDGYLLEPALNQVVVEPRLHARAALSETVALRLGAGLMHQAPAHLLDAPGVEAAALRLGMQRALQVEAGADVRGPAGFTFGADVFVHPMLRTVELDVLSFDMLADDPVARGRERTAEGHGYGVELMARRPLSERWSLLASYTFQRRTLSTRVERRDDAGQVVGAEVMPLASALEQMHVLNAAVTVKLPWGLTVGTTLHYNTGAPEAGGLLFSYTQQAGVDPVKGTARWRPVDRDQVARLPGYFRVDGRVSKTGTLGPLAVEAWLDVFNLSLTKEAFRYTYGSEKGQLVRKPFGLPPVTLPSLGIRARY